VRNGGSNFQRCLEAIRACDPAPHEVIVVDDGSADDSARVAREWDACVLETSRPGSSPAQARNLGARAASGEVVLFVDADVALHPDAIGRVACHFAADPDLAACFGSYDDDPAAPNFLSQYKNLFHHYVHQSARADASTFWAGCGAIRRGVFLSAGGFDERYDRPAIEDIELGYRLKASGLKLRLDKKLQGKHLKEWALSSLLRSDILDRGVPWTELILRGGFVDDLNLQTHNRVSVVTIYVLLLSVWLGPWWPPAWLASALLSVILLMLNRSLYRFFVARRGWFFALRVVPMHWLYYVYNGVAFAIGLSQYIAGHLNKRRRVYVRPHWVVFLVSAAAALLPSFWVVDGWEPQSDEPHYLIAAHSLARDRDLDLANNYALNDQWSFYPHAIDEHVRVGRDGRSYLSHDLGLPILIAPAYALAGRAGVTAFLAIIAALVAVNVYLLAVEVTGSRAAALVTWPAMMLTPLLSVYAYRVYPEMIGALVVVWSVRYITFYSSRFTLYSSRSILGAPLAIACLPWLSARYIPIAAFLVLWSAWRWRGDGRRLALVIGIPLISLAGYFAANAWMGGGESRTIDFDTGQVVEGFEGFSVERLLRGLTGWWLDQQRGVLIYSPIYLVALIGLPLLWRRLRWRGLALLSPLVIACASVAAWGGFWVAWEISARYLVVGLPLLAAPMALAFAHFGAGARRAHTWAFRIFASTMLAISLLNTAILLSQPGVFGFRESIVLAYDSRTPVDLWSLLPAMGGGSRVDPDPDAASVSRIVTDGDRTAWHSPAGAGGIVLQSAALKDLSVGAYELRFEARAGNAPAPDAPLLSVDVFSGEGVLLLHRVLRASDFDPSGAYRSFALPFQSPFYNRWGNPVYAQVNSSGLADTWISAVTVTVDGARTWGVVAAWIAIIGLLVVAFNWRAHSAASRRS
jgi:glycosyltransferase involved in cell wall biosynthesis